MAQVVLKDLNKKYDEVHAVKDVNLTIRDKEFMVFVGPSGCGKTTTLRMVAGLEEITSGRDLDRRAHRQRPPPEGPGHRDGVPELRALPAHERVRQHGLRPQDAEVPQAGDRQARPGRGRDPRHPGAAQAQAAPALGRPAPARGRRPGHRPAPSGVPVRRAAVEPRRQAPRPDARRAQAAARAPRDHRHLRDPRPGRGDDPRQPGRGDEGRLGPAGRRAHGDLQPAAEQVRGRLHRLPGDELHPGHDHRAERHALRRGERRQGQGSGGPGRAPGRLQGPVGGPRHPARGLARESDQ